ncbi:MAG: ATP-binding protein [Bacteroidota bacterium]
MRNRSQHIGIYLKLTLILSLTIFPQLLTGQNENKDSIQYLLELSERNWHNDIPLAQESARKAFQLIQEDTRPELKAEAYAHYGVSFYSDLKYDSAIHYYQKATKIAVENDLKVYRYLATTTSALEKTGRFLDVIKLIDKRINISKDDYDELFNLLMIKLSASISLGFTEKSDSALRITESIYEHVNKEKTIRSYSKIKGRYFHLTAQYKKSDSVFINLLNHYKNSDNLMDEAEMYLYLAQNAMEVSRFNKSSDLLIKAQAIYDSLGYEFGQANIDLFTGTLLSWMGKYNDASDYIFKSLEVFENSHNRNEIMIAYYELGWIFYSMDMVERAKKYLNQAYQIAKEISNIKYLGSIHNVYGSLYSDLEKLDSAITHFDSAIYYQEITQNIKTISATKFNKALVLEKSGQKKEALDLYQYSYGVDKKLNNDIGLIIGEWVLGEFYKNNNNIDSAQHYFQLGQRRAEKLDEKNYLLKIYQGQADIASIKDEYKLSNDYLQKALKIQEELSNENKALELATLETTYDLKNKEKELALLNLQKKNNEQTIALNQKTIQSQRNTLIALSIGLFVLAVLSYIIFRYLRIRIKVNKHLRLLNNEIQDKQEEIMAQSEELKEANDQVNELNHQLEERVKNRTLALENALSELDHFFYRASHDFRGPLTTLLGLVEVSKSYNLPPEAKSLFDKVNITVKKLDGMVKKLQAVSFLGDFENLKSPKKIKLESKIKQIANEVIKNKSSDVVNFNYDLKVNTSVEKILFYPVILNICLSNLIENSLAFNSSDKIQIIINAIVKEGKLILSVEDNGTGISKDVQDDIFSMFKRTSHTSTGNGLGLYIVKKAVEKLNGQIELKSETRFGSTFILIFPLSEIGEQTVEKE